jgi:hypothetical protein
MNPATGNGAEAGREFPSDGEGLTGGRSPGGQGGKPGPQNAKAQMERLDALIAAERDEERLRAGMGMRLALGMAQELKEGKPFGTDTMALVAAWTEDYGQDSVDAAVRVAREFLTKPDELRKSLGQRLGLDGAS